MPKNRYHSHKKHCSYFSLYWTTQEDSHKDFLVHIIASKKSVHKQATKRNFVKRRLRAITRDFFKMKPEFPVQELVIIAKREVLTCSFLDLTHMLNENLRAISSS